MPHGPPDPLNPAHWIDEEFVDDEIAKLDPRNVYSRRVAPVIRAEALTLGVIAYGPAYRQARNMVRAWNVGRPPILISDDVLRGVLHPLDGSFLAMPSTPLLTLRWWTNGGGTIPPPG